MNETHDVFVRAYAIRLDLKDVKKRPKSNLQNKEFPKCEKGEMCQD